MFALLVLLYLLYAPLPSLYHKFFCKPRSQEVLLSFDDGPSEITADLLDLLKKHQKKAIFFLLAVEAKKHHFLVKRMVDEGHLLGLHGSTHRSHLFLGPLSTYRELMEGYRYLRVFGEVSSARLPYGRVNLVSLWTLRRLGLRHYGWDHILVDWKIKSSGVLAKQLASIGQGVVLLHDGSAGAADPQAKMNMLEELGIYLNQSNEGS